MALLDRERRNIASAQQDLVKVLGVDKSNVARLCAKMVEAGHLLQSEEQEDGRTWRLSLTPKGRRLAEGVEEASRARFDHVVAALPSDAARTSVIRSLDLLNEAISALDEMDTRVPVPLLPMMANHQKQNMRDHLLAIQEIVLASGRDDFAGVERAANRIGFSPAMGQMCTHMGAGAKGFTEQALAFHHTADSIAVAARKHDRAAVMSALGTTLQACTACHETFRQRVVDQATWTSLTSMPAPTGHHPGG